MDGLCRCTAAPVDVRLGDVDYWLEPLTLGRLGICENHILRGRRTPLEVIAEVLPQVGGPIVQAELYRRAYRETWKSGRKLSKVTWADMLAWLNVAEGVLFSAWLCLRDQAMRPLTLKQIQKAFQATSLQELQEFKRLRDRLAGIDLFSQLDFGWEEPEADDGKPAKPIPWAQIYRDFAKEPFCWGPEQVNRLTIWQVRLYRSAKPMGGRVKMSLEEAQDFLEFKKLEDHAMDQYLDSLTVEMFGQEAMDV